MNAGSAQDPNDWEWVRVLAQGRVYDESRSVGNRLVWAAVALAASRCGERCGVRRDRAVADRFALRARVVRSLGVGVVDPDRLVVEALAEDGLGGRYEKSVARAVGSVVALVRDEGLRDRARRWVEAKG